MNLFSGLTALKRRTASVSGVLALALVQSASGQALDIGGIELRLGQDVSQALQALSSYQVRFNDQSKAWFVTQKIGDRYEYLGSFGATKSSIATISKHYRLPDETEARRIYTQALRDVRRRGGQQCISREVEYTDDLVHEFETRCGAYKLVYTLPWLYEGDKVGTSIYIFLGSTR